MQGPTDGDGTEEWTEAALRSINRRKTQDAESGTGRTRTDGCQKRGRWIWREKVSGSPLSVLLSRIIGRRIKGPPKGATRASASADVKSGGGCWMDGWIDRPRLSLSLSLSLATACISFTRCKSQRPRNLQRASHGAREGRASGAA